MWSSNSTSDYIIFKTLERIWIYNPNTEISIYPCFYQKMEGIQMFINRWMSRQKVVYMYNGILFNLRKVFKKIYNMDEIWGHYSKRQGCGPSVTRLTSFLWVWFQCVCPLMPSCNTYHLTWVSLTLGVEYLFSAAPAKCSQCSLPWTRGMPVGQPKMGGSWWRDLTECGPLEKGMANHFSILALRTPWTAWKGGMIGYWKRSSPGW